MSLRLRWNKLLCRSCRDCFYFPDYFGKTCFKHKKEILNPYRSICEYYDTKKM